MRGLAFVLVTVAASLLRMCMAVPLPASPALIPMSGRSVKLVERQDPASIGIGRLKAHSRAMDIKVRRRQRTDGTSGSEALLSEQHDHTWYSAKVELGSSSPPVVMDVLFDTGSSDAWVASTDCTSCSNAEVKWNPDASSTSVHTNGHLSIGYADGASTSADVYQDNIKIAGMDIEGMHIAAATEVEQTADLGIWAIFGLSYPAWSMATPKSPALLQTMIDQKLIDGKIGFSFAADQAEMYLGGWNLDLTRGDFNWIDVARDDKGDLTLYLIEGISVIIGDKTLFDGSESMHFDTGSTVITAPKEAATRFYQNIPGSSYVTEYDHWAIPCNAPDVTLVVGGRNLVMRGDSMTRLGKSPQAGMCWGSVMAADGDKKDWTIGIVGMQNWYTTFDYAAAKIGFASLTDGPRLTEKLD